MSYKDSDQLDPSCQVFIPESPCTPSCVHDTVDCRLPLFSTVSSAIQSLAAVVIEDMVKPVYMSVRGRHMTEQTVTWTAKGLGEQPSSSLSYVYLFSI